MLKGRHTAPARRRHSFWRAEARTGLYITLFPLTLLSAKDRLPAVHALSLYLCP